ncbi:hypothetical protein CC1G_07826 [Coprinopsis cinerea okayama7|uniref:Uncharacterized protein n=1 Tax=Coprinopsis cinerea (strain Okayama-7 / 130 / ATCC MYA-4618 / FGSC 9003) TaxID=240176 RepID=A8P3Y4_COPC7|nr:hypothetical protein CC1G_07826 [Coprinopsis cinerea okayama7\|eukprot:XP_001838635.2 hypothetical protein CC1G_07826 [Coprinopsis cinerea okayama7\
MSSLSISVLRASSRSTSILPKQFNTLGQRFYAKAPEPDNAHYVIDDQTQGNIADEKNVHKKDVHSQAARGGREERNKSEATLDAASQKEKTKAHDAGKGNPEGIGMVDQVGSASGSAEHYEQGRKVRKKP